MGIYDREYYRREGPSILGSFSERGHICKWLIGINVIMFVLQLVVPQQQHVVVVDEQEHALPPSSPFTDAFILDADKVLHGQIWRLLSYAFLHDPSSLMHLLFNMLFLWWFGSDVEDLYGPKEFLIFYLFAAVVGGMFFTLAWAGGLSESGRCLGASGAVTAVLVLCAIHYPTRIIYLFFMLPVPIWAFVVFSVAFDAFHFLSRAHTGVAVTVHLGGAAFAFAYYKRHWRLLPLWSQLRAWQQKLFRPKLRVYREEPRRPVSVASPPMPDVDDQLEARLDAILEKVARYGRNSLSESENQLLLRASEIYKRRRS
jgi:membrane associated rhomboid family serine protease